MPAGGQITMNGVSDAAMIEIIKAKDAAGQGLIFAAGNQIVPQQVAQGPNQPVRQVFNNIVLAWATPDGLKALGKLLETLAGIP